MKILSDWRQTHQMSVLTDIWHIWQPRRTQITGGSACPYVRTSFMSLCGHTPIYGLS